MPIENAFLRLHSQALAAATRPYLARGISVLRCQRCQLETSTCICNWRRALQCNIDVLLLMHHDEIFKPTNTGRLIADILPDCTQVFEWSRTAPVPELLALLEDPQRYCVTLFPGVRSCVDVHQNAQTLPTDKKITLVLLDGTWRQASKMVRCSDWLKPLPQLLITAPLKGQYQVRQAHRDGQLATAEAAAQALQACGEVLAGSVLTDYFSVFHQHYLAMRMRRPVTLSVSHQRLAAL